MLKFNSLQEMHDKHCSPEVIAFIAKEMEVWDDTAPIQNFEEDFGGYVYVAESLDDSIVGTHLSTDIEVVDELENFLVLIYVVSDLGGPCLFLPKRLLQEEALEIYRELIYVGSSNS